MRARSIVFAFATSFSMLVAPAVHADPPSAGAPPVNVVAIRSYDTDDQAEALTVALRSRVRALHGWSLGEGDHSLEILTLGLKCNDVPDQACQAKIAKQIGTDRYIWGTMHKAPGRQVSADLHLWARNRPSAATQVTYSDNLTVPGDDALRRIVDEALGKLLGRGETGTVVIRSKSAEAGDVYVDGSPSGAMRLGEMRLDLAPGTHQVELRSGGGAQTGTVNVRPGVSIELVLAPTGGAETVGAAATETTVASRPNYGASRVMGWAALGMGAVLVGGGVYSLVRVRQIDSDDGFERYRQGFRPDQDVCDEARAGVSSSVSGAASPTEASSLCNEASTFQVLQYVFFGLGAVSTGAGIYLLVRDPGPGASAAAAAHVAQAPPRWRVTPQVGRSTAGLRLQWAF
jgi:hypothetical protein